MAIETKVNPTGTGQQGAGTPAGVEKEIPIHIEGGAPTDPVEHLANKAARRGLERQQHDDPTIFTK
jgi:hypothetical protein